jgi:hypothetical protein
MRSIWRGRRRFAVKLWILVTLVVVCLAAVSFVAVSQAMISEETLGGGIPLISGGTVAGAIAAMQELGRDAGPAGPEPEPPSYRTDRDRMIISRWRRAGRQITY